MNTANANQLPRQRIQRPKFKNPSDILSVSSARTASALDKAMAEQGIEGPTIPPHPHDDTKPSKADEQPGVPKRRWRHDSPEEEENIQLSPWDRLYLIDGASLITYGAAMVMIGAGAVLLIRSLFYGGGGGGSGVSIEIPEIPAEAMESINGGFAP